MTTTSKHRCVFFDDAETSAEATCACGARAVRLLAEDGTDFLVRLETGEAAVEVTVGAFGERPAHLAVSA